MLPMKEVFPPYYYKKFIHQNGNIEPPNLDDIKRHTHNYFSFGEFQNFQDFERTQLELLVEEMKNMDIDTQIPVNKQLTILNKQILDITMKINESLARADGEHVSLTYDLTNITKRFNKICTYLRLRESYEILLNVYTKELQQINECTQKIVDTENEVNFICSQINLNFQKQQQN